MHKNTKYWFFTWETNINQKQIPSEKQLRKFLDRYTETCTFQQECGSVKGKVHWQGALTLLGPRKSKKQLLELFGSEFGNVAGLTLSKVYSQEAVLKYVMKEETRIDGPFLAGRENKYRLEFESAELLDWQSDLYKFLALKSLDKDFRDRKIIWVEDRIGNTGKTFFQKWLRLGQQALVCRKLPVSTVERLISATVKLFKTTEVDLIMIDLTRSRGKDQSLDDLFAAIEEIKNGFIVDTLYGKYTEGLFRPPMVVVFTNKSYSNYLQKLSSDRWFGLLITSEKEIEKLVLNPDGTYTRILLKDLTMKN